jgi:hypothetical protein
MGIDVVSPDKLSENGFNIAIDLRYDHLINYNPDNPTIGLVVEKEGTPDESTKFLLESWLMIGKISTTNLNWD